MELNTDFDQRVSVHAEAMDWVASPMPGVDRKMLDRIGDEVARATSIVRYAPGSHFSAHTHGGGEEFLVLDGVFQDEHGDYPAGTYVRNPPETSHTPGSEPGCTIFVKLWQFDPGDRKQFHVFTGGEAFQNDPAREGVSVLKLHDHTSEQVSIERWGSDISVDLYAKDGMELFVVEGSFDEGGERFGKHSWLRLPKGAKSLAIAGPEGATVWIKRGHLANMPKAPAV